jgi:hypothetical protein
MAGGKETKMNIQKSLWQIIGVALVLVHLVGCGIPTVTTPMPPTSSPAAMVRTASATPIPATPTSTPSRAVQGWAVLAQKEDYTDVGEPESSNVHTNFLDLYRLRALLLYSGWEDSHVLELRDTFGQDEIRQALDWLAVFADADDLVLFYYHGHGSFLREDVRWSDFFAEDWAAVPSQRRLLVLDACHSGEFTAAVADDPLPHLSIASVSEDEFGWTGLWEEGLPIVGAVFTHYFIAAFSDPTADVDGDGAVSVQEAAVRAEEQQRGYMHNVVWTVPEFSFPEAAADPEYPHVVIDDTIGEPVYLDLDAYP